MVECYSSKEKGGMVLDVETKTKAIGFTAFKKKSHLHFKVSLRKYNVTSRENIAQCEHFRSPLR